MGYSRRAALVVAGAVGLASESAPATGNGCRRCRPQVRQRPYGAQGYVDSVEERSIATVGIGAPDREHVTALGRFRDDVLLEQVLCRAFVRTDYAASPPSDAGPPAAVDVDVSFGLASSDQLRNVRST